MLDVDHNRAFIELEKGTSRWYQVNAQENPVLN